MGVVSSAVGDGWGRGMWGVEPSARDDAFGRSHALGSIAAAASVTILQNDRQRSASPLQNRKFQRGLTQIAATDGAAMAVKRAGHCELGVRVTHLDYCRQGRREINLFASGDTCTSC